MSIISGFVPILSNVSRYLAAREENWDQKKADKIIKEMGEINEKIRKEYRKFILFRDAGAIVDWEYELVVLLSRYENLTRSLGTDSVHPPK